MAENMADNMAGRVHKACDFCRYRKRKCMTSSPTQEGCDLCKDMSIPCQRSYRRRSDKLRHRSRQKAVQALVKISNSLDSTSLDNAIDSPVVYEPREMAPRELDPREMASREMEPREMERLGGPETQLAKSTNVLSPLTATDRVTAISPDKPPASIYNTVVRKFTPYLENPVLTNPKAVRLLQIACELFVCECLTLQQLRSYFSEIEGLLDASSSRNVSGDVLDKELASVALLLLNRVPLSARTERWVYFSLSANSVHLRSLPICVAAGAIMTNAWSGYLGVRAASDLGYPTTQLDVLQIYNKSLDQDSFAKQYLILSRLLIRMQHLFGLSFEDRRYYWLRLEYDFLIVPLHVPKYLLDLRDDLPGTPYGRILHVLVNTINFDFYLHILKDEKLQQGLQLKPVPAVHLFMLVMAITVFRYGREVLDKWNILVHCQAKMAFMCLKLLELSDLEYCKEVLSYWRDDYNQFPELYKEVQDTIGSPPWITEKHSGYSVFWTFRDMRSLHVEGMLPNSEMR